MPDIAANEIEFLRDFPMNSAVPTNTSDFHRNDVANFNLPVGREFRRVLLSSSKFDCINFPI